MKKQFIGYPSVPQDDAGYFYKVADVDARIAELEKALRELNDLCVNASRNHMDIDPEVHGIVKAALGL